jgi:hypothetical protein
LLSNVCLDLFNHSSLILLHSNKCISLKGINTLQSNIINSKRLQPSQISLSTFKTLKSHDFASTIHPSKSKRQGNTYKNHIRPRTPPMLQGFKAPTPQDPFCNHFTCKFASITYWKSIRLEIRLHKHVHIQKGI